MIFLVFEINGNPFALAAERIHRIIPFVSTRKLPRAPEAVAGLLEYRGASVPVLDLSILMGFGASPANLSTRTILTHYMDSESSQPRGLLGLVAPAAIEIITISPSALTAKGIDIREAPYLGAIASTEDQFIQTLNLDQMDQILPEELKKSLFADSEAIPA